MDAALLALLSRFEEQLDPAHPVAGNIPLTIVGYGEISAVLQFDAFPDVVCKRLAGFESDAETAGFQDVLHQYCDLLTERGVDVVPTESHPIETGRNGRVVYLIQQALPADRIGNAVLKTADDDELRALLRTLLQKLVEVYTLNGDANGTVVALDAQISNWVWMPEATGDAKLVYIDVGAPFIRRGGRELMDFEPLVRAFPAPIAWYMRRFEMQEVIDRYYRLDAVLTDLAGNFIKEGRADRIDLALEEFAAWAEGPAADLNVRVPTRERVEKYYNNDARIWTWVLAVRKLDRFVTATLLRRRYSHILPGNIRRR